VAAVLIVTALAVWRSLPSPLFDDPLSTVLLARDGTLLGARIADDGQWRFPPLPQVPEKFARALIAYEDKRFRSHPGVDPLALARAVRLNSRRGRIVSGASTLSMQVIRLARERRERGYGTKLLEILLALRLELQYSKDEILALYAGHAPFGGNVVGLEAAAWRYFGRNPAQLSWAEACTLAVLPNSPALIHPARRRAALQEKRDRLLHRLHEDGAFSGLDLDLALREPLPDEPLPLPQFAPHLLETLRARHPGRQRFETTLDAALQKAMTAQVQVRARELARQDIHNAAALAIDNRSFEVLAYVGNVDWSVRDERGMAVDIVRRPRSSGSILKPLLYAAMLEAGEILPRTLVPDVPTQISGYAPENFDRTYRGAVPAEVALAQSLNVPAVRMLRQHGVHRFYDFLGHFGMSTLTRKPEEYGLTLILGGAEATLWDVGGMYANVADIARRPPETTPAYRQLKVMAGEAEIAGVNAEISAGAAWLTLSALLEVARPGEEGYWRNFASTRRIAWKTGTSFGLRDGWAVGNTTHHTVAVWTGNASGEGRPGLTGSAAAAPLLFDLFNLLPPGEWFAPPQTQMKEVEVCRNDGYLSNGQCETEVQWVPRASHFDQVTPHNLLVHLDAGRRYRVHSDCERVADMGHASWFVLPPGQEFYYRRHHGEYRPLPPFRSDCESGAAAHGARGPMDFLYPGAGTRVYIPVDLAEKKGRVVFEAVHRDPKAAIHWHLDDQYLGTTRTFHQQALDIVAGEHVLTIVDQQGNHFARRFEVLGREK
jgi:penicillin-binding protein 1C